MLRKDRWNLESDGPMTEQNIRRRYEPPPPCRVSKYRYEPGDSYEGISKATTLLLTEGTVSFDYDGGSVLLMVGDVISFDGGRYLVRNRGPFAAVAYWVWTLPIEMVE